MNDTQALVILIQSSSLSANAKKELLANLATMNGSEIQELGRALAVAKKSEIERMKKLADDAEQALDDLKTIE